MTGALKIAQTKMPAIYISKYNRFVDNVIGRINRVLGKSYDPVRVKMPASTQKKTKSKGKKGNQKGKGKGKGQKKNATRKTNRTKTTRVESNVVQNKMGELPIARAANEIIKSQERLIGMYDLVHIK